MNKNSMNSNSMNSISCRSGRRVLAAAVAGAIILAAQIGDAQQVPRPNNNRQAEAFATVRPGDALSGLSAAQLASFNAGLVEFTAVETEADGLGPIFNGTSCAQCHSVPGTGGSSTTTVTRFGRVVNGVFDPLTDLGGSLLQKFAIDPAVQEVVPKEANVVAQRLSTPIFGAGLVEAIPDATIQQLARQPKPDGVRGRVSIVDDVASGTQRVGRFGWKAQQATLTSFAGDAYVNVMGVTNRLFPVENAPNGNRALLAKFDKFMDPEDPADPVTGRSDIDSLADFMRLLAPVLPTRQSQSASDGERLFAQIGCAACHTPSMQTGPSPIAAIDRKTVGLYSDLLLHDMGRLGDGIAQGTAGMREMKTAALWGLRLRQPYLHDGRASTIDEAIRGHDGEAQVSRDRYQRLNPVNTQNLLDFLRTL